MSRGAVPWEKIYDYVMACGGQHDPYRFVVTALEEVDELIPYDQGLAYCLDERRRVQAQHLVNIKNRWSNLYLDYFSQLEGKTFGLETRANEQFGMPLILRFEWDERPISEFTTNYIMARGVKHTLSFTLFDQHGLPRAAFALDRTRDARFTERDEELMRLAAAPLGNLYKNFFTDPAAIPGAASASAQPPLPLTAREQEVVGLLCQGLSPALVAETLSISVATAYKHIAHIHKKLGVSTQQELLVRVLGNGR